MIIYENERFGQNNSLIIWEQTGSNYPTQHFHRNYELIYVYDGQMSVLLDEENLTLGTNEFVLIFPNQIHSFSSEKNTKSKLVIFSPNYIKLFYEEYLNKLPFNKVFKADDETRQFIVENLKENSNEYTVKACLYAICGEITKQTDFYEISTNKNLALTHNFLAYMTVNFTKNITLKDVAADLGYNHQYLSRYINKRFSMSFCYILNSYRVDCAIYLLKNTDKSISSIAYDCGFESIRSFNKNFNIITSKSPREYRKIQY